MDFFAPDKRSAYKDSTFTAPWKIIIADDEQEVHSVTRMVLADYLFDGQELQFLSAYSGDDTRRLLLEHTDTAVILLDVVMEKETAGLEIVQWIREELQNGIIRIILRTGQPGYAPETQVVINYDINDYKEKTELTSQKLLTTITTAIRGYRDLKIIDRNRQGLLKMVEASGTIFELTSLKDFTAGVLIQLTSLLNLEESSMLVQSSGLAVREKRGTYEILAATGDFALTPAEENRIPGEVKTLLDRGVRERQSFFAEDAFIGYYRTKNGSENLLFLRGKRQLQEIDRKLVQILSSNITVAFDNVYLKLEMDETQRELIQTLGEVVESRHAETGHHVVRVAHAAHALALELGLSGEAAGLIMAAAPMHDIGKIVIPEEILFKPGKLAPEEYNLVKSHTRAGFTLLSSSKRETLKLAATIALHHHENWDGSGYPAGLAGDQIPVEAQIVGLVDAVDALAHDRVYARAWDFNRIVKEVEAARESRFSSALVDAFLKCRHTIEELIMRTEQN